MLEGLKQGVLTRLCEMDFTFLILYFNVILYEKVCTKLRKIAGVLKIQAAKVEEFVREAIVQGVTTGTEIYAKVIAFMKEEVLSKTCVDFLAPRVSHSLYPY